MIYIKEDGVTVEDSKAVPEWVRIVPGPNPLTPSPLPAHLPPEHAEILLRGLLRWKLEHGGGWHAAVKLLQTEYAAMGKERNR